MKNIYARLQKNPGQISKNLGKPRENYKKTTEKLQIHFTYIKLQKNYKKTTEKLRKNYIKTTENLSHSKDNFFCYAKNIYARPGKKLGQTTKNIEKTTKTLQKLQKIYKLSLFLLNY